MYDLILRHRDALMAAGGILDIFAEDEVRILARPTRSYVMMLSNSFHPDLLRTADERDRFLERLSGDWRAASDGEVGAARKADLERADIPLFTSRPDSTDVLTSTGVRITGALARPGLGAVKAGLEEWSEAEKERQLWIVRKSIRAASLVGRADGPTSPYLLKLDDTEGERGRFLEAAEKIGDKLEAMAFRRGSEATWFDLAVVEGDQWHIQTTGASLYGGLPGIALFLAQLAAVTGKEHYREVAAAAVSTLDHILDAAATNIHTIGAYSGWGGIVYLESQLFALWGENERLAKALEAVSYLERGIEDDSAYDLVGGAAGAILALWQLGRHTSQEVQGRALEVAFGCGERLLAKAQRQTQGIGWPAGALASAPLTGLAHGTAGIALSLAVLGHWSSDERFLAIAGEALAYERGHFSPAAGNWRDLRHGQGGGDIHSAGERFMTAWCYGAPGIGLSRLALIGLLEDDELEGEVAIAVETTLKQGLGYNHSLCHGDLGNLELPLAASRIFGDEKLRRRTYRAAAAVLASIETYGWRYGLPLEADPPGLMVGLAGLGYGLLRLADPDRIPSVLVFGLADERRSPGQERVENRPQRVDV